jgi:hypothetical protein
MPNKTDAGNGSYGICRVIDASRSPSPDPGRSAKKLSASQSPMKHLITTLSTILVAASLLADDAKAPKELLSLKESWTRARKQATEPIDKKFEDALTAMKQRFTKAGDLEAALAVDSELKALASPTTTVAETLPTTKDWAGHTVRWGPTWSWELLPEMKYRKLEKGNEVAKGEYTIEPDGRIRLGLASGENFMPKSSKKGLFYKGGDDKTPKGEVTIDVTKK